MKKAKEKIKFEDYEYMINNDRTIVYRMYKKTLQRLDYIDGKRTWVKDKFDKPLIFIDLKHLESVLDTMGININEIYYID